MVDSDRDHQIELLYKDCFTLREIGEKFSISRERVRQILRERGVHSLEGGAAKRRAKHLKRVTDERERACHRRWGVSRDVYNWLRALSDDWHQTPMGRYLKQRANARARGISWELSFDQWWGVWQESGRYHARGRESGQYVMSRFGDKGAYELGNVFIQTCNQNCKESGRANARRPRLPPPPAPFQELKSCLTFRGRFT